MAALLAQSAHWGLALIPVLILLAIFNWLDSFALMRFREVALLLVLGGLGAIAVYPVSGRMLDTLPIGFSNYSRFIAPWIEEAIKGVIVIGLFRFNRIGYKLDAVISGFAIGAGFSVVENILYLTLFPDYGTGTWLVRGLGTAVMHGATCAILAASAHEFAERETRGAAGDFDFRLWWFVPGYLAAVALHTLFNQFPERPLVAMIGAAVFAPVAILGILQFGTAEAAKWLEVERTAHKAQLAKLAGGGWPDGPSGRMVAALADRLGPKAKPHIHRYWEVQVWLVIVAEQAMIDEADGDAAIDRPKIAAAFAELAQLKAVLGRSRFAALRPMLPFSRNDYWEVAELRQRLGRKATIGRTRPIG